MIEEGKEEEEEEKKEEEEEEEEEEDKTEEEEGHEVFETQQPNASSMVHNCGFAWFHC